LIGNKKVIDGQTDQAICAKQYGLCSLEGGDNDPISPDNAISVYYQVYFL